jgi:two-component system sensor histidine kinase PilS (NtrC family)
VETICNEPVTARVDPNHLEEVLHILADNSIKHGRAAEGKVLLAFAVMRDEDGNSVIDAGDNGPGIAPSMASRIFDPFVSSRGSTGIGLFLARQLCEANDAKLLLRSDPAAGAVFRIRMQAASH